MHWNLTSKCPLAFHSKDTGSALHTHNENMSAFCHSSLEVLSTCIISYANSPKNQFDHVFTIEEMIAANIHYKAV